ncbi:IS3 family transposase [Sphingobacterium spiritivorum]
MFYLKQYESTEKLKCEIEDYISYYNNQRIKLNLK